MALRTPVYYPLWVRVNERYRESDVKKKEEIIRKKEIQEVGFSERNPRRHRGE
jgi:hypothetical protein